MSFDPQSPAFEVRPDPSSGGLGVFASRPIRSGERLGYFSGEPVAVRTRMSLQFGGSLFIEPGPLDPLRNLNHACAPSAHFTDRDLHASRDLHVGEAITIDYSLHEAELASPFPCKCGSENCLERVQGWKFLAESQKLARVDKAGGWLFARC